LAKRSAVRLGSALGGQRDVRGVPCAGAAADLPRSTRAGIERILMERYEQHVRILVERVLRSVAVVYVPVDDRDARHAARACSRSCKRDVVEQTEAHAGIRHGVVAGRTGERDAALPGARSEQLRHVDDATSGEPGCFAGARREVRVRVQVAVTATEAREQTLQIVW